ncbi:MAG: DUF3795 domain-containing protein [Candidatus Delongbacteria bacterium]|nr:DUF3795 domain-containing protein [Candidatus Delongbacteria bacterium]
MAYQATEIQMVAPCGINCGECKAHQDDPKMIEFFVARGIKRELLPCPGCRALEGHCPFIPAQCETYRCVTDHKVDFCFQCPDFPCRLLNPCTDRADILPHNTKVFNLCCIEHQGLQRFLERHDDINRRYFKGKMVIGGGPQIDSPEY